MNYGYLDEDKNVVPCTIEKWTQWERSHGRYVEDTHINGYRVSTVFLGLDHSFGSTPRWFETMVFEIGSFDDLFCQRYETWNEAKAGHQKAVQFCKQGKIEDWRLIRREW